ncbi:peptidyl-prolyl cis-trans isomerase [Tundrisphaera sp. TA3]|uniref:peptidylprolyl isomerase n=1 Tax=Tundrisphaera sp. TA3 TaxID=3435775 RepID=UPI003EBE29AC
MDRRIVSGFACVAIVVGVRAETAHSQVIVPPPPARLPTSPLSSPPVGFEPVDSIRSSINGGSTLTTVPGIRPIPKKAVKAVTRPTYPPPPPVPGPATLDPATVPSTLVDGADLVLPPLESTAMPAGRPAPYAGQVPSSPRLQAAPASVPSGGRPAPYAQEVPSRPRPQAPAPRPAASVAPPVEPPAPEAEPPAPGPAAAVADPSEPPTVTVEAPAASAKPGSIDLNFMPASVQEMTSARSNARARSAPVASRRAAAVGEEVITMHELEMAVNDMIRKHGQGQQPDRATLNRLAAQTLDMLIEESLINQVAKRKMGKSAKSQTMFNEYAERKFREAELTPLLRSTASSSEYELNNKLMAESGRTVNELREAFRRKLTAQEFLWNEIRTKVSADVSEMRDYYNEHLANFDRPAQVTWREVEVDIGKSPDRATARQKADAVLDRLRRGEDFEVVARSASDGATKSRGGLWETTPGGFADPVVNHALDTLPIGQISQVLEGPTSFRIVRVEGRREAGPARFDEVQDQINKAVFERNYDRARDRYLAKLRKENLVITIFDKTASDPAAYRQSDPSVQASSAR